MKQVYIKPEVTILPISSECVFMDNSRGNFGTEVTPPEEEYIPGQDDQSKGGLWEDWTPWSESDSWDDEQ